MICDVYMRRVGQSGHVVLAEGVNPDVAAWVIMAQPSTPGYVIWRFDRV